MRSPRLLLTLPAVAAAVGMGGCIGVDPGPTTTQTRDAGAFTHVDARDHVDLLVRTGRRPAVVVRAGEKVIDDIHTDVRGGTLHVSYDGPGIRNGRLLVEATVPELRSVMVDGAADVELEALDERALDITIDGSGDVAADGRVRRLAVEVSGAGDADLSLLRADAADVELSGAGDAELRVRDRLDAEVTGAGDLRYVGDPAVRQRISGSGDIEHAG